MITDASRRAARSPLPLAVAAAIVFGLCALVYVVTTNNSNRRANDVIAVNYAAWQLAHHHTLDLDHIAAHIPWAIHVDHRVVTNRFPGPIFLAVPFYWLLPHAHVGTAYPGNIAAALTAAAGIAFLFVALTRVVNRPAALAACAVVAFATPTWSVSADGMWTHAPAQLALAISLAALASDRPVIAGLGFGLAVLNRPHLALIGLVTGLALGMSRRSWSTTVKIGIGAVPGVLLLVLYDWAAYGSPDPRGGYSATVSSPVSPLKLLVNIPGVLVSPGRGILIWSPFLIILALGMREAWRTAPDWVRWTAVGGGVYLVGQLLINRFSGGYGFYSYRLPLEALTAAAPLLTLAGVAVLRRGRRGLLAAGIALAFALQAVGAIIYVPELRNRSPWTSSDFYVTGSQHPVATAVVFVISLVIAGYVCRRLSARGTAEAFPHSIATCPDDRPFDSSL